MAKCTDAAYEDLGVDDGDDGEDEEHDDGDAASAVVVVAVLDEALETPTIE